MVVASLLTSYATLLLRRSLASKHEIRAATNADEFSLVLTQAHVDVAIVDPCWDNSPAQAGRSLDALIARLERAPTVPFVAYYSSRADVGRGLIRLARAGAVALLQRSVDDDPATLLEALLEAARMTLANRLLVRLADRLDSLDPSLARVIRELFEDPSRFTTAGCLAAAADISRRTLDRRLENAGFQPARFLMNAARTVYSYRLMMEGHFIREVPALAGLSSKRQLEREVIRVTNHSPAWLAAQRRPDMVLRVIGNAVLRVPVLQPHDERPAAIARYAERGDSAVAIGVPVVAAQSRDGDAKTDGAPSSALSAAG